MQHSEGNQDRAPYTHIAMLYDEVMNHVNYRMWSRYVRTFFSLRGKKVRRVIDLSCGTGNLLAHFAQRRRQYVGSDISWPMLRQANQKAKLKDVPFICADFRQLPFAPAYFDVALILYDSINYVLDAGDILKIFTEVADILEADGLFIFDVVTPEVCRKEFSPYHETMYRNDHGYERKSWFDEQEQMQYNEFAIVWQHETKTELHKQKIRTLEEWQELLAESPFKTLKMLSDFSYRKLKPYSKRVHFICKKAKS